MTDHATCSAAPPLLPSLPRLTLGVWLSTLLVFFWAVGGVAYGIAEVVRAAVGGGDEPDALFTPLLDPRWAAVLGILLAGLVAWCQYHAVFRRRAVRSFVVGAVFFVLGVVMCLFTWDGVNTFIAGTYLFIGIMMCRWGGRLVASRRG
jgi:hypothetical protein